MLGRARIAEQYQIERLATAAVIRWRGIRARMLFTWTTALVHPAIQPTWRRALTLLHAVLAIVHVVQMADLIWWRSDIEPRPVTMVTSRRQHPNHIRRMRSTSLAICPACVVRPATNVLLELVDVSCWLLREAYRYIGITT